MSQTITTLDANDRINAMVKTAAETTLQTLLGYELEIRWPYLQEPVKPDVTKFWLRVSYQTVQSLQTSLSTDSGVPGQRRFTNYRLCIIQVFGPKDKPVNGKKLVQISEALRNVFRKSWAQQNLIIFRNMRYDELSQEENFYRSNVVTEFEHDEFI